MEKNYLRKVADLMTDAERGRYEAGAVPMARAVGLGDDAGHHVCGDDCGIFEGDCPYISTKGMRPAAERQRGDKRRR